jgi:hypothetical protein
MLCAFVGGRYADHIEQLPRTLAAAAHFALAPGEDALLWQITVTLAPADLAALDALRPSASQLCASAQHTLGLAALGSQIDPSHGAMRVRDGDGPLIAFVDAGVLWWSANTPPPALLSSIDRLIGESSQ